MEQKSKGRLNSYLVSLRQDIHLFLHWDIGAPGSQTFGLWDLHQQLPGPQVFGLRLSYTNYFPGCPFFGFHNGMSQYLCKFPLYISIYVLLVQFLCRIPTSTSTSMYIELLFYVEPSASHYGIYKSGAICSVVGEWHLLELCSMKSSPLYRVALRKAQGRVRPRVLSHSFNKH